jgi:hypothetical protein
MRMRRSSSTRDIVMCACIWTRRSGASAVSRPFDSFMRVVVTGSPVRALSSAREPWVKGRARRHGRRSAPRHEHAARPRERRLRRSSGTSDVRRGSSHVWCRTSSLRRRTSRLLVARPTSEVARPTFRVARPTRKVAAPTRTLGVPLFRREVGHLRTFFENRRGLVTKTRSRDLSFMRGRIERRDGRAGRSRSAHASKGPRP